MSRSWRCVVGLVALSLVFVACGGGGDGDSDDDGGDDASSASGGGGASGADDVCTEDRVGGELTVGQTGDLNGFDPTVITGASRDSGGAELTAIYDTLMRSNPETGEIEPHLAQSLEPNDDLTQWTLRLREGVEFGNGDPLTAEAVIASIQRFEGADVAAANFVTFITGMDATDERTVVFSLDAPWGDFPYFLASAGGMVVNTAAVDEAGAEAFNTDPPPGAGVGPFQLVRYAPGEEVVMEAKDDYWGGPVCVQTVRFVTPGDDTTRLEALDLGEIDVTVLVEPRVVAQARDEEGRLGFTGYGNGSQLMINARPGHPGEDVRVRQAMAAAIDPEVISDRVNEGQGVATTAIVHPDSPLYSDGLDRELVDPDRAEELVEEAKADGWDGRLSLLTPDTPGAQEISITVEALLEAVGMDVTVDNPSIADMIQRVTVDRDFDVTAWSLNVLPEAPWSGIDRNLRSDSPTNRTGYANDDFDAALADLRQAGTVEERREAIAAIQEIWDETIPGVMYQQDEEFLTWSDRVHGVRLTREGVAMLDDVYVDQ
jgi:peptide/nickel transport system substrate-binding protein